MRIHIKTTPNTQEVPFSYQTNLVGSIHKWLGQNEYHGKLAMFSFSNLQQSISTKTGLSFPDGSGFFISAWEKGFIQQLIKGIMEQPEIAFGMKATDVTIQQDPDLSSVERFQVASPVFIKRWDDEIERHYLYSDPEAGQLLTQTMHHKMKVAGFEYDSTLNICFDISYPRAKTKKISYLKNEDGKAIEVENRSSVCPVIIKGAPETKAFAWNVGVGSSTGIGFGAIKI